MQCEANHVLRARGTHNSNWMLHMSLLRISGRAAGVDIGTENNLQVFKMRTSRTTRPGCTISPSGTLTTPTHLVLAATQGDAHAYCLPCCLGTTAFDCSLLLPGSTSSVFVTPVCRNDDLPAEALDNLFERLDYFTALHLARTCQPCATAFHHYHTTSVSELAMNCTRFHLPS